MLCSLNMMALNFLSTPNTFSVVMFWRATNEDISNYSPVFLNKRAVVLEQKNISQFMYSTGKRGQMHGIRSWSEAFQFSVGKPSFCAATGVVARHCNAHNDYCRRSFSFSPEGISMARRIRTISFQQCRDSNQGHVGNWARGLAVRIIAHS